MLRRTKPHLTRKNTSFTRQQMNACADGKVLNGDWFSYKTSGPAWAWQQISTILQLTASRRWWITLSTILTVNQSSSVQPKTKSFWHWRSPMDARSHDNPSLSAIYERTWWLWLLENHCPHAFGSIGWWAADFQITGETIDRQLWKIQVCDTGLQGRKQNRPSFCW